MDFDVRIAWRRFRVINFVVPIVVPRRHVRSDEYVFRRKQIVLFYLFLMPSTPTWICGASFLILRSSFLTVWLLERPWTTWKVAGCWIVSLTACFLALFQPQVASEQPQHWAVHGWWSQRRLHQLLLQGAYSLVRGGQNNDSSDVFIFYRSCSWKEKKCIFQILVSRNWIERNCAAVISTHGVIVPEDNRESVKSRGH